MELPREAVSLQKSSGLHRTHTHRLVICVEMRSPRWLSSDESAACVGCWALAGLKAASAAVPPTAMRWSRRGSNAMAVLALEAHTTSHSSADDARSVSAVHGEVATGVGVGVFAGVVDAVVDDVVVAVVADA